MLKKRILTAVVLIPLFVLLVLKLSPQYFAIFTGIIVLLGAYEWSFFMGVKKFPKTLIYPAVMFVALYSALFLKIPNVMIVTFLWWLYALLLVVLYPKWSVAWGRGVIVRSLMGFFVLIPCWLALNCAAS